MSFNWLSAFRTGQWLAFRRFVLEERKDVGARVTVIDAELNKIGKVIITYASTTDPNGDNDVSEERTGISVRKGTSLCKLLQAYIAMGGNPFDISMFMYPDSDYDHGGDDPPERRYPGGGVVYMKGSDHEFGGQDESQHLNLIGDRSARIGTDADLSDTVGGIITHVEYARRWCQQGIVYKRSALEKRIIKLADCAEQLTIERDELITGAVGGLLHCLPDFDLDQFAAGLRLDAIVAAMDRALFEQDADGAPDFTKPDLVSLAENYPTVYEDKPEEAWTAL